MHIRHEIALVFIIIAACDSAPKPKPTPSRSPPSPMATAMAPTTGPIATPLARPQPMTEEQKSAARKMLGWQCMEKMVSAAPWMFKVRPDTVVSVVEYKDNMPHPLGGKSKLLAVRVEIIVSPMGRDFEPHAMEFVLKDAERGIYKGGPAPSSLSPALTSSAVDPGEMVQGWFAFEVPPETKPEQARLRYESFGGERTQWMDLRLAEFEQTSEVKAKYEPELKKLVADCDAKRKQLGLEPAPPNAMK